MILLDFDRIAPRESWLGRGLRWPLDHLPKDMAMPILSGPLLARRWLVGAGIHRCWLGTYERRKQLAIRARMEPGMVAYDIGANSGFYSLLMASCVGNDGRVYAFEPELRNVAFLRRHLELNRLQNVRVMPTAVGDHDGRGRFAVDSSGYRGCLDARGETFVPVASVDHLVETRGIEPADIIKIDVEGAELAVLKGAQRYLKRFRPLVFLATHGAQVHQSCCELLRGCGYRLQTLDGDMDVTAVDELVATTH